VDGSRTTFCTAWFGHVYEVNPASCVCCRQFPMIAYGIGHIPLSHTYRIRATDTQTPYELDAHAVLPSRCST